ncbi:MAG: T9SS type A sorting domain-containing protein [Lewinellaceae bacterium]|nr:T9SS type A sorting domain-containing protein [Lewinellaceae bacterium]
MKKTLLLTLALLFVLSSQAQNEIQLQLSPRLGSQAFALNAEVSAGNYSYKITRLEYYISEVIITHDGGQTTPVSDMHLLVRPAIDSMYNLGEFPGINSVEAITFSVGVDQAVNHLDPAAYPANNPLSPQNPSMHWGWTAGYRFAAIEGVAGTNFANNFEIHALGDQNYKTLNLNTTAEVLPDGNKVIDLIADYAKVLNSINVSGGPIVHGTSGSAVVVLNNMKNLVFSATTSSATINPAFTGQFKLMQNPVTEAAASVGYELPAGAEYRVTLTNLSGRVLLNTAVPTGTGVFQIEEKLTAGLYFVHLWENNHAVAVEKLVVVQ